MRLLGRQSTDTGQHVATGVDPVDEPRDDVERLAQANGQLATLLTGLLESAHAEIAIVDEHSHFVAANGAFREQFLHGGDPTGMSLSELAGRLDDPPLLDMLDVVRQVITSDEAVSYTHLTLPTTSRV